MPDSQPHGLSHHFIPPTTPTCRSLKIHQHQITHRHFWTVDPWVHHLICYCRPFPAIHRAGVTLHVTIMCTAHYLRAFSPWRERSLLRSLVTLPPQRFHPTPTKQRDNFLPHRFFEVVPSSALSCVCLRFLFAS